MSRLPELSPGEMTPEQEHSVYDAILAGPRGQVRRALAVGYIRSELAARAQALGAYCRYNSSLPKRLSELAILVTARHWGAEFEWFAHRKHALDAGLSEQVIEAIRKGKTPNFGDAEERTVFDIAVAIYPTAVLPTRSMRAGGGARQRPADRSDRRARLLRADFHDHQRFRGDADSRRAARIWRRRGRVTAEPQRDRLCGNQGRRDPAAPCAPKGIRLNCIIRGMALRCDEVL